MDVTDAAAGRIEPTRRETARALGSAMIGNWFELFDFIIYGYFAAQIGHAMFPEADPVTIILSSFATYGVGFVMRPVGGVVLGHFGDLYGRKSALVFTMLLMAGATGATGLIPSYATIGIAAPILLVICRLLQGFAAGGEWGGATTFLVEYAPAHRRGFYGALQQLSTSVAILSALGTSLLLNALLTEQQMIDWGWRIPFLLGFLVAPVGFYLRRSVRETPRYRAASEDRSASPIREVIAHHRGAVANVFGVAIIWCVAGYTFGAFLISYATELLHIERGTVLLAITVGTLVNLAVIPLAGHLSDRFGRKPFLVASATGFLLFVFPLFHAMATYQAPWTIYATAIAAGILSGLYSGCAPTFLCELLPTRVRYSALSVGYNGAVMLFGGFAPFIATLLIQQTGALAAPAFYVMSAAALTLVFLLRLKAPDQATALDR
ncbi:MAG TPA: MFS transporter [Sphingopyxis sp.]|nr:MFS transporter [Sphingopyxis sp.]